MEQDEICFGDFSDVITSLIQIRNQRLYIYIYMQFKMPMSSKYLVNFNDDDQSIYGDKQFIETKLLRGMPLQIGTFHIGFNWLC
jgi:hypothetical protein